MESFCHKNRDSASLIVTKLTHYLDADQFYLLLSRKLNFNQDPIQKKLFLPALGAAHL
jgi:hypothetical protein